MTARELLEKLRSFFTLEKHPTINRVLEALRNETPAEAGADLVIDQVGAALRDEFSGAVEFAEGIRGLGIENLDQAKQVQAEAEAGRAYRADLLTEALAEGVRAQGEKFDKDLWERTLGIMSVPDIKAVRDQFAEQAEARLGKAGRQTSPPDPNKPALPQSFNDLPPEEQDRQIKAFLARTDRGNRGKPEPPPPPPPAPK